MEYIRTLEANSIILNDTQKTKKVRTLASELGYSNLDVIVIEKSNERTLYQIRGSSDKITIIHSKDSDIVKIGDIKDLQATKTKKPQTNQPLLDKTRIDKATYYAIGSYHADEFIELLTPENLQTAVRIYGLLSSPSINKRKSALIEVLNGASPELIERINSRKFHWKLVEKVTYFIQEKARATLK